eukprot:15480773-Alexandrium_andersonii.AAC.1
MLGWAEPGCCCRLEQCLCVALGTPKQRGNAMNAALEALGVRRGCACPVCVYRLRREFRGLVRECDFVSVRRRGLA